MLIGSQYSDNKVYRGIRYYDHLPLTSSDIHEYADTVYMKTAYIMNNIVGHGVLNTPLLRISTSGIRLQEPAVLLIDGDISLIQSDDNTSIIDISKIRDAGLAAGSLCIVGWYQAITAQSTMRNYGGVENSTLPNDLIDNEFKIQVSTRYQFRWTPVIIGTSELESTSITFDIADRDDSGELIGTTTSITSSNKLSNVFVAPKPSSMSYSESDLYIVPLFRYVYDEASDSIITATNYLPLKTSGSSAGFIKSEEEPRGEYSEGTTWYNPITREFKTYIAGTGFVDSAATMGFLQYQSIYDMTTEYDSRDIVVPINISQFQEGDILQVSYEGLTLMPGIHYTLNYADKTITLKSFSTSVGDKILFNVTKIVEANDITNITQTFVEHLATTGSSTVEGHLKLSDNIDDTLDSSKGVAATPKSVYESTLIKDTSAGINYKFVVDGGVIYLEEV